MYVLAIINSRATRFYYDMMISDGLSVVPSHVNHLRIPDAPPEVQTRVAALARNIQKLRKEFLEEQRLGSFRPNRLNSTQNGEDT